MPEQASCKHTYKKTVVNGYFGWGIFTGFDPRYAVYAGVNLNVDSVTGLLPVNRLYTKSK
ncbi:hypothetical protein DDR33_13035 [Pararcticibacter amylolyticus]|uniref:Uncharacterized protein n=1 Tax=Pararcticibacter amylolyticus TaxID=2173175 RepID=A0A2U2PFH9_9SPHI|nr:hypothetical protein DDR33_13035 [Pararcticibacter amylolyticus]